MVLSERSAAVKNQRRVLLTPQSLAPTGTGWTGIPNCILKITLSTIGTALWANLTSLSTRVKFVATAKIEPVPILVDRFLRPCGNRALRVWSVPAPSPGKPAAEPE